MCDILEQLNFAHSSGPTGGAKPVAPPRKPNRVHEDLQPIGIFTRSVELSKSLVPFLFRFREPYRTLSLSISQFRCSCVFMSCEHAISDTLKLHELS